MTELEYKAVRKIAYAYLLQVCYYILIPALFVLFLINPAIGFTIQRKFEELADELNDIAEQLDAQSEIETPPVIRQVM